MSPSHQHPDVVILQLDFQAKVVIFSVRYFSKLTHSGKYVYCYSLS